MRHALRLAERAAREGEIPVGALACVGHRVVGEGWNQTFGAHDPAAHAEIQAMRHAAAVLRNPRLTGVTLVTTLEPCTMCLGALLEARVQRVVYGASDPARGALEGWLKRDVHAPYAVPEVVSGVLADACLTPISRFFERRREGNPGPPS